MTANLAKVSGLKFATETQDALNRKDRTCVFSMYQLGPNEVLLGFLKLSQSSVFHSYGLLADCWSSPMN